MRVAMVAPLHESVPPQLYGGTERVVSYLTEALVDMGVDVTLFATGDSLTAARLHAVVPRGLRLEPTCRDPLAHHVALVHDVAELRHEFDVLHFHIDYVHLPLVHQLRLNAMTTIHGRLDIPDLVPLYRRFSRAPLVSISDAQRAPLSWARWLATVHHGLPANLLAPGRGSGGYLAFLGRISPEKRPDRAIRIARAAGIPLRIAAKIERGDQAYFDSVVRPLLDGPGVEFVGEIGDEQKSAFLGEARAVLFPIDWPEPFGLVQIEAMACGTPVIAFRHGAVPEIIEPGLTGFIVESEAAAIEALDRLDEIDRAACRLRFEERFSARRMAGDYLKLYQRQTEARARRPDAEARV
jgi:glycosyltransferase involved in cell wall biosynthesis